jgi:CxxC-x17-CxxC domain-containing protein
MEDSRQNRGKRFGGGRGSGFGGRDGGRSNFAKKNWGGGSGGRDRGPVTMHEAVCDECGNSCEVPFRPTEGKPVYCNVCFGDKKKTANNRGEDNFSRKNFTSNKAPERTDLENNFYKENNDAMKKQLEILNVKLDRLINIVEGAKNNKPAVAEEKREKKAEKITPTVKARKPAKKTVKKKKK